MLDARSTYHSEKREGNHMENDNKKARDATRKQLKNPRYQIQEQQSQKEESVMLVLPAGTFEVSATWFFARIFNLTAGPQAWSNVSRANQCYKAF